MSQVPGLKEVFSFAEIVDNALDALDGQVATFDPMQKRKKQRMDVSKSKGKSGSMLYVRGIFTERFTPSDRLHLAKDLEAIAKGLMAEKSATMVKRSKMGSGCKDEMQKVCEKLTKVPDIQSNPFGETRVLVLKPQKKQVLDTCSTNANIGVVAA